MRLFFVAIALYVGTLFGAIQAVAFDFGGVVASVDRMQLVQFMMDSFPISEEESIQLLQTWAAHLKDEGDETEFWEKYAASIGAYLSSDWLDQFHHIQASALHAIPQTLNAIMKLKSQGYRVALLSNVTCQHAAIIRSLGFYELFNPTLLSYEMGIRKPDARAYQILLEQLALPPDEVLFIDDQNTNVVAAKKLGIHAIHFVQPDQLEAELQTYGICLN